MKVCIVTVYNSTNCGSFLQAYGLKYILEKMGHEVSFLETGVKKNRRTFLRKAFRSIKKGKFRQVSFDRKKLVNFEKALKAFPICPNNKSALKKQDVFVLGSDEIWNISRDDMRNAPIFWGSGLEGRIISYAPSVNTSTSKDMDKAAFAKKSLEKMAAVSVRDEYSKKLIAQYTDKPIKLCCDPTFLLPMDEYKRIKKDCPYDDFILVYSAGAKFTDEDKKAIQTFAKKQGKKLIAFPHNLVWCDIQESADPLRAIDYFMKADYVITDTFHGAALSLVFNKDFLAVPRGNTKVSELLRFFNVPQLMAESAANVEEYFSEIRYDKNALNKRIYEEREKAKAFLAEAVGEK